MESRPHLLASELVPEVTGDRTPLLVGGALAALTFTAAAFADPLDRAAALVVVFGVAGLHPFLFRVGDGTGNHDAIALLVIAQMIGGLLGGAVCGTLGASASHAPAPWWLEGIASFAFVGVARALPAAPVTRIACLGTFALAAAVCLPTVPFAHPALAIGAAASSTIAGHTFEPIGLVVLAQVVGGVTAIAVVRGPLLSWERRW